MILRFRFSNFRSFREEQELSLVASTGSELPGAVIASPVVEEGGLRAAALYGANASGKSNVLKALSFMIEAVRNSFRSWAPEGPIPHEPFALLPESRTMPSRFILDFVADSVRYQYGFSADAAVVHEEWLHAYPSGRRQEWFVREKGRPIQFSRKMPGENRVVEKNTRPNCLFLSAAAQHNHTTLTPLHTKLSDGIRGFDPTKRVTQNLFANEKAQGLLSVLVRAADVGIESVRLVEKRADPQIVSRLLTAFDVDPKLRDGVVSELETMMKDFVFEHRSASGTATLKRNQQSDGTLAYLDLMGPVSGVLAEGSVLLVDELDRSLHPVLSRQLVQVFNSPAANQRGAQLIFNTHDTNVIDTQLLRRDQIWFTEKDREGESHLYPLTDFHPRKSENIASGYLQGRYGAIPYLNSSAFDGAFREHRETSNGQEKKSRRR